MTGTPRYRKLSVISTVVPSILSGWYLLLLLLLLLCLADILVEVVLLPPVLQVFNFLQVDLLVVIRDQAQHDSVVGKT